MAELILIFFVVVVLVSVLTFPVWLAADRDGYSWAWRPLYLTSYVLLSLVCTLVWDYLTRAESSPGYQPPLLPIPDGWPAPVLTWIVVTFGPPLPVVLALWRRRVRSTLRR